MPISPFMAAINQICDEKGLDKKEVISAVEQAVAAAYRKDYGKPKEMIRAQFNEKTGGFKIFQEFEVVNQKILEKQAREKAKEKEEKYDPAQVKIDPAVQLTLKEAKKIDPKAKLGSLIKKPLAEKKSFGRIAAQTAKQVIIQRLRESERNMLFNEYKKKENQLISGVVQQIEGKNVIVNIGKTNAILPPNEQVSREHYYIGQRLRLFIKEVVESSRGPHIIVSRAHPGLLNGLFMLEVPEISAGTVQIKAIAREPGLRSKVAIATSDPQLDPVGTCVGQRGARIQAILAEIGDEKIDIIVWDKDPKKFLINALAPAQVEKVTLAKDKTSATIKVPDDQLSLAIGKNGQNVRLASKLTGIEIDILKGPNLDKAAPQSNPTNKGKTPATEKGESETARKKTEAKKEKSKTKTPKKSATDTQDKEAKAKTTSEKPAQTKKSNQKNAQKPN